MSYSSKYDYGLVTSTVGPGKVGSDVVRVVLAMTCLGKHAEIMTDRTSRTSAGNNEMEGLLQGPGRHQHKYGRGGEGISYRSILVRCGGA